MKRSGLALRPQDVLLLLKLIAQRGRNWRQLDLAMEIGLSQAEVANGLARLRLAGLVNDQKKDVHRLAAIEFLVHALKYILPPEIGAYSRGIPTAFSAKPMRGKVVGEELPMVWPSDEGDQRGLALEPIYPSVPHSAKVDPELHELLAIVDSLRVGGVREKKVAEEEIRKRLLKGPEKRG